MVKKAKKQKGAESKKAAAEVATAYDNPPKRIKTD